MAGAEMIIISKEGFQGFLWKKIFFKHLKTKFLTLVKKPNCTKEEEHPLTTCDYLRELKGNGQRDTPSVKNSTIWELISSEGGVSKGKFSKRIKIRRPYKPQGIVFQNRISIIKKTFAMMRFEPAALRSIDLY